MTSKPGIEAIFFSWILFFLICLVMSSRCCFMVARSDSMSWRAFSIASFSLSESRSMKGAVRENV